MDDSESKIYFLNLDDSTGTKTLCSVMYEGIGKKGTVTVEDTNVVYVELIEDGKIIVDKDSGSGKKDLYIDEKLVARDVVAGSVKKTEYGDDYVFAYQDVQRMVLTGSSRVLKVIAS